MSEQEQSRAGNTTNRTTNLTGLARLVPNRFMLCVGVSKRARQLKEGMKPTIHVADRACFHPVLTALTEIDTHRVRIILREAAEQTVLEELEELTVSEFESDIEEPVEEVPVTETKAKVKKTKVKATAA